MDDHNSERQLDEPADPHGEFENSRAQTIIEDALAKASSEDAVTFWIRARKEILEQQNGMQNENHRRWLERRRVSVKLIQSFSAIPVGLALLFHNAPFYPGSPYAGLFILGLAFYGLAPDAIKGFLNKGSN
jgi:hypothetical protein